MNNRRKFAKFLVTGLLLLLMAVSLSAVTQPVSANSIPSEKPILVIQFYYDNPCSSCPTVDDFYNLVWQSAGDWSPAS